MALVGCGGITSGDTADGGTTSGGDSTGTTVTCTRVSKQTALLSTPLPLDDVYSDPVSDGTYVYVGGERTLYRVPTTGGAPETVSSDYLSAFYGVSANKGTVVWPVRAGATQNAAGLTIQNARGSHDVPLPSGASLVYEPLVVDREGDVFFELTLADSTSAVQWWDPSTGAVTTLTGVGTAQSGVNLYFADRGQLFWAGTGTSGSGVFATDFATAVNHLLDTTGEEFGSLIGVDETYLYGAGSICPMGACPFTISRAPRDGTPASVAYQTTASYWTNGISADASGIYWIDWVTDAIFHAAPDGSGSPSRVATLGPGVIASQFGMDDCNLYWTANGTGGTQQVMAAPK